MHRVLNRCRVALAEVLLDDEVWHADHQAIVLEAYQLCLVEPQAVAAMAQPLLDDLLYCGPELADALEPAGLVKPAQEGLHFSAASAIVRPGRDVFRLGRHTLSPLRPGGVAEKTVDPAALFVGGFRRPGYDFGRGGKEGTRRALHCARPEGQTQEGKMLALPTHYRHSLCLLHRCAPKHRCSM